MVGIYTCFNHYVSFPVAETVGSLWKPAPHMFLLSVATGELFVICNSGLLICCLRSEQWPAGGPLLTGWRAIVADKVVIMGCSRLLHQRLMEACSDVLLRHVCCHDCRLALLALVFSLDPPTTDPPLNFIYFSRGCPRRSVCPRLTRALW